MTIASIASQAFLLCLHLSSLLNEEIDHFSPPIESCQVEGGVAILIFISEGRGVLVHQEAGNSDTQGVSES